MKKLGRRQVSNPEGQNLIIVILLLSLQLIKPP